jgi:hypothetical protein
MRILVCSGVLSSECLRHKLWMSCASSVCSGCLAFAQAFGSCETRCPGSVSVVTLTDPAFVSPRIIVQAGPFKGSQAWLMTSLHAAAKVADLGLTGLYCLGGAAIYHHQAHSSFYRDHRYHLRHIVTVGDD